MSDTFRVSNLYSSTVGVGTSSALTTVHVVAGFGGSAVQPVLGATTNASLLLMNSSSAYGLNVVGSNTGAIHLQSQYFNGGTSPLAITLNPMGGNVGIGTSSPGAVLHVVSPSTTWSNVFQGYSPNITTQGCLIVIGKASSNYNNLSIQYNHISDGSASNFGCLQMGGVGNILNWTGGGYIGIGVTNPGCLLQVYGSSSNYNVGLFQVVNSNATPNCVGSFLAPNMSAATNALVNIGAALAVNNAFGIGYNYVSSGSNTNFLQISAYGTSAGLNIQATGNVGIGTTAPACLFNPYQTTTLPTISTSGFLPCQFAVTTNALNLKLGSYYTGGTGEYCAIQASEYYSSTEHPQALVLQPIGGTVGIGTSNTYAPLNVGANTAINGINMALGLIDPTNNAQKLLMGTYYGGGATTSYSWIQATQTNVANNALILQSWGGNVGVGTTNPSYPLDVSGIMRATSVISSTAAHYIGYTTTSPTIYQSNGTNNTSGTLYTNVYNYVAFPTNTQTPSGFITTTGGKYVVAYNGIYTITFTTGTAASNNAQLETFIAKNQYNNSSDLNQPGTGTMASSYHPASTAQWCFSWTGYLSTTDFFTVGFFTSATAGYLTTRTTLSVALVCRTG